jgi:hypothetical protein
MSQESVRLQIQLECPKCGAPFAVDDEQVSVVCVHCSSLLSLQAPEREEIYIADSVIQGAADIVELVVLYTVQAHRAEVVCRYQDSDGNPPSETLIERKLREFEQALRGTLRVVEARRLHAPYWHLTGAIVQAILGRHKEGPKFVRLRAFAVEHTVAGYDTHVANLRDRGLRLARGHVRPLFAKDVREGAPFLAWRPVPEQHYREIDKWRGQDLDTATEPVTKHAGYLFGRRVLVYRPYWLARVISHASQEWVLIDGSFGTIGGHPSETESRELLHGSVVDPLHSGEESFRRVRVIPSRCPDCGSEESFDPRYRIAVCSSCHLGLRLDPDAIRVVPYAHVPNASLDSDYLPFWRFEMSFSIGGKAGSGLQEYLKALFPQGVPGFEPRGMHVWVPASRLLGTQAGDAAAKDLCEWIHSAGLEPESAKIPLGGHPMIWGVALNAEEAEALAPFVVLALHGKASAARLNTLLFKKAIADAKLAFRAPTLVMVPAVGPQVPRLVLAGGPELDAQRVTVQAVRAGSPA